MMVHGIEDPSNIRHDNTLARPLRDYGPHDQVDIIVTNPPFGGIEEDGIESNFPTEFRTRETADLFLVLAIELLKPGGRAAVVLPDGTLFGDGIKARIKKRLLDECNLHTIVRLPEGVFAPYTTIKTNILFFTKGEPTKEIWYYEHPYPAGRTSYTKRRPMLVEEFESEKAWWGNRSENDRSWRIPVEQIVQSNYNLDFENPRINRVGREDPLVVLQAYRDATVATRHVQESLYELLADALSNDLASASDSEGLIRDFASVCTGPGGSRHLRQLFLNLAFSGRLVPQDPHEQSANALVEKVGRPVTVSTIDALSHLPSLPSGWTWTTIEAIAETRLGKMLDQAKNKGQARPYLRNANAQWFRFDLSDLYEIRVQEHELEEVTLREGDLVVCEGGEPGRSAICDSSVDGMVFQKALHRVRPVQGVNAWYLAYLMRALTWSSELDKLFTGATIKHLTGRSLKRCLVPLPPSLEQNRIVERLHEVMRLDSALQEHWCQVEAMASALTRSVTPPSPLAR